MTPRNSLQSGHRGADAGAIVKLDMRERARVLGTTRLGKGHPMPI